MRDLLKLDIVIGEGGLLELKPSPINGIQAEIRLMSSQNQIQSLRLLIPEIESIVLKLNDLFISFSSGKVTTYFMVQEVLKRFDTPNLEGVFINDDFLMDLIEEIIKRLGRIEALVTDQNSANNVQIEFNEVYEQEVTEDRKASLRSELDKIQDIPKKIEFLEKQKIIYLQDISFRTFEVSGKIIGGGFQDGPIFFDRFIELEIKKIKLDDKNSDLQNTVNWKNLIEIDLLTLIEAAEIKANPKSSTIRCAAFCEVLYQKKYIKNTKTRIKTMTSFAVSRYNMNIKIALNTSKKTGRERHKINTVSEQTPINKCF